MVEQVAIKTKILTAITKEPIPFTSYWRKLSSISSRNHQKHLRFGQSFSSLLSPQSFSWSHLRTAPIQFPLSHVKSEDPQVDETVAKKENMILIKYRFFFIVQGPFGRGPNHTTGGAYMYRHLVCTTFVSKNVQFKKHI